MPDVSLYGLLNTGLLGVYTHKIAMSVVGHNIANTNTQGFSRQRPLIVTTSPIPVNSLTQPSIPLQFGTGSKVTDIQRVRDEFLDVQYRQVTNRYNYWDTLNGNMHYIEQLFGEPGETGLRTFFDSFWSSMEEIKTDPTNEAAKGQIVSRATELKNVLYDIDYRLEQLQIDLNDEIKTRVDQLNSAFKQIAYLNDKISSSQVMGSSPNDLLDERDRLLDQISELSNVRVNYDKDFQMSISVGDRTVLNGKTFIPLKVERVPGEQYKYAVFSNNTQISFNDGKMKAIMELRDSVIKDYRSKLDEFALTLNDTVNLVYQEGWDSTGNTTGARFFKDMSAKLDSDNARLYRIASSCFFNGGPVNHIPGSRSFNGIDFQNYEINMITKGQIVSVGEDFTNTDSEKLSLGTKEKISTIADGLKSLEMSLAYNKNKDLTTLNNYGGDSLNNRLIIDFNSNVFNQLGLKTKAIEAIKLNKAESGQLILNKGSSKQEVVNISVGTGEGIEKVAADINAQSSMIKAFTLNDSLYIVPTKNVEDFNINNVVFDDKDGIMTKMGAAKTRLNVLDTSEPTLQNVFNMSVFRTKTYDVKSFDAASSFEVSMEYADGTVSSIPLTDLGLFTEDSIGKSGEFKVRKNGDKIEIIPTKSDFNFEQIIDLQVKVNGTTLYSKDKLFDLQSAKEFFAAEGMDYNALMNDPEITWKSDFIKYGINLEINGININIDPTRDTFQSMIDKINSTGSGLSAFQTPNGRFALKANSSVNFDMRNITIKGHEKFFELLGLKNSSEPPYKTNYVFMGPERTARELEVDLQNSSVLKLDKNVSLVRQLEIVDTLKSNPSSLSIDLGKGIDSNGDWKADYFIPIGKHSTTVWNYLSKIKELPLLSEGKVGFSGYLASLVAEMGISGENASKMKTNSQYLKEQIDGERERVKGVSIDEEVSNMIKYQQAFNASARVITAADEMINKVVNGLGLVGR